ncbi:MAG: IS3 family transposase, partial [Flavobacteriales bacterium]
MVRTRSKLSIRSRCELLGLHRSGIYYTPKKERPENLEIMRIIDERHIERPTHGVLRMQDHLRDKGYYINSKRIRRLMRLMDIQVHYPKRNLSKLGLEKYIYPYLLRDIEITHPDQVWATDITYIPMARGFMYLTAFIDLYSRFVVGWDVSNTMETERVLSVLEEATSHYDPPGILNSDQGGQYTCSQWVEHLKEEGVAISMDGKGRAIENAFIERLWRRVKYDHIYLHPAENGRELYEGLKKWFYEYNYEEKHQGI